jgi:hypothetical protein
MFRGLLERIVAAVLAATLAIGAPGLALAAEKANAPAEASKTRTPTNTGRPLSMPSVSSTAARPVVHLSPAEAERLGFSQAELQRLAEKQAQAKDLENYEGGVAIVIGSTVVIVALAVILVLILVD